MVGYQKDDSLTSNQKLIAGCISGVITRFITQPLDVVKVRTQLQSTAYAKKKTTHLFRTTMRILREEGPMALWHGHSLGQVHSILAVSSQFFVYELTTKYSDSVHIDPKYKPLESLVCGFISGSCSTTLVLPLEVIRVRQMILKAQYGGFVQGAKQVYKKGGIAAFYEGWTASILQMGPAVAISFFVFNELQRVLIDALAEEDNKKDTITNTTKNKIDPITLAIASTTAGCISGFVSKFVTYPFDLAKRRLQIKTHHVDPKKYHVPSMSRKLVKCTSLIQCLRDMVTHEGILGLYRGFSITLYKAQLTSMVAFTVYELSCHAIREYSE